jgi:hypothetical protein
VFQEAKPTAGDFLSPMVFTFKADGTCYGYLKEGEEAQVTEVHEEEEKK